MERLLRVGFSIPGYQSFFGSAPFERLMTLPELMAFLEQESSKPEYALTGRVFEVKLEYVPQTWETEQHKEP